MTATETPSIQPWRTLTVLAGLFRLLPETLRPWNFAPLGAFGLYAGARIAGWQAIALPIVVLLSTNAVLDTLAGRSLTVDPFQIGGFLGYVVLGRLIRHRTSPVWIGGAAVVGSVQFYLVTNFGAWLGLSGEPYFLYERSLMGLGHAYLAGLPFYRGTFLGDLVFTGMLFGLGAWLARRHSNAWPVAPEPSAADPR